MIEGLIIDSFAGGGGASLGIERALGRSPDVAINHDAEAIAMHKANHPDTLHLTENVWKVDPHALTRGRHVALLWASPDCFLEGSLVLTPDGLVPIEDVAVGDLVLTHKSRWREVTSTMKRVAETVEVRGYGHYGLITTPDHQFYSKRIVKRWPRGLNKDGRRPGAERSLVENPFWPSAREMKDKLWATPTTFPESKIPTCKGAEFFDDFFYFVGRWLGDGSLNKGDVELAFGRNEADRSHAYFALHPLRRSNHEVVTPRVIERESTRPMAWGNADLAHWLMQEFGVYCEGKRLPLWCLSMQKSWREALLRGYTDADGFKGVRVEVRSVSKALSVGIRLLATSLGYAVGLYKQPGKEGQIENRNFMGRDCYTVAWREELKNQTIFTDQRHMFMPVRDVLPAGVQTVVSLEVDEDESLVVDGIVVHNCRHHSKAKGGAPVSRSVRGLADVVLVWARVARPNVIILENVEEFRDWGPITDGKPCPNRRGADFARWVRGLEAEGYEVEWNLLRACDYGAPTIRRRLYLVARRDGRPIVWPAPTHGDPKSEDVRRGVLKPWRTAAEIIDWSLQCPSIFLTRDDAKAVGLKVQRPLADKTLARIARGFKRYVLDRAEPFLVVANHGDDGFRGQGLEAPFATVTASRDAHGVVAPYLVPRYQERDGQEPRTRGLDQPSATVVPGGNGPGSLIAPYLGVWRADHDGRALDVPAPTVTANSFIARPGGAVPLGLIAPVMAYAQHGGAARPADAPMHTVTASAKDQNQVLMGYLAQHNGNGVIGRAADEPLSTVTQCGAQAMPVVAYMATLKGKSTGAEVTESVVTVHAGGGHHAVVLPHLSAYYATDQAPELDRPAPTATTRDRFARVDAPAEAPPLAPWQMERARQVADFLRAHGAWEGGEVVTVGPFVVWDIGMRMLTPRELARAQGFPDSYVLAAPFDGGALTETAQRARIGNSVCPDMAEALVRANVLEGSALKPRRRRRAVFDEPPPPAAPAAEPGLFTEAAE